MSDPTSPYGFHDDAKLIADVEADDQRAVAYAYRKVFGGPLGRLVLTHQLHMAGVGQWRDPKMGALERAQLDGCAEQALRILDNAGFGPVPAAHLIAAHTLEGQDHDGRNPDHDRNADSGEFGGPDPDPDVGN